MKQMFKDSELQQGTMNLFVDDISAIDKFKNPVQHSRTKHIDICHHFIRELVEYKVISLKYVKTENQLVGILTKPLDTKRF